MKHEKGRSFYIHTFGCQMNQADSAIITAILMDGGFRVAGSQEDADIVILNTCAVRENAVERITHQLQFLRGAKRRKKSLLVGVAGCVPQHLKREMLEMFPVIDFLAGPDTYRNLPALIGDAEEGKRPAALEFRIEETYAGIDPLREVGVGAFVPVTRGCNNMCAFCVVPFTRGRERSQPFSAVMDEVRRVVEKGYGEITLLGQNVNSYADPEEGRDFASLLRAVSREAPGCRIRFTTSHPKDISPDLVDAIADSPNICNHVHLPVQSGSSRMLHRMNRGHGIDEYLETVALLRRRIPGVSLTTDLIAGFCGEEDEDHEATLALLREVRYDNAFMFYYSPRFGTAAWKTLADTVPLAVKKQRLQEIIDLQLSISAECLQEAVGSVVDVLAESESRRSTEQLMGRTGTNRAVVFDRGGARPGDRVSVLISKASSATLTGVNQGVLPAFYS
ncbi:MAG TPA: tRNA (N6-isopentenyl adenosine(37)-C2)-methylthiotransferase MiaB [Chlorobium sp.]|uniref:tRNA-2-methylthio-N(6)-dimethylallyladenosine synthase n=1 Tax=Chlorobium phaeovibrioides (strain DSM 265 / 1930) TaxID=290318 RepID=MIAB_CHLPM|nr:RecName: Full=tRNA-2-methylthio-N(6)-dimethylallyladenosine synthase; AltName: Full=(Dimethylallyl)adenosine tRNA methylthiotransferase MiaB; AltName: Full=tRNA-i(6)A37 methylthiotransferase [Chlorobium phaeovibrioides DSM 265]HCD36627.1 tRNA (N6-isopentenyl adenosine(37)-C2)-methylthiotransferase MiaB [Chlorobium sp.]